MHVQMQNAAHTPEEGATLGISLSRKADDRRRVEDDVGAFRDAGIEPVNRPHKGDGEKNANAEQQWYGSQHEFLHLLPRWGRCTNRLNSTPI